MFAMKNLKKIFAASLICTILISLSSCKKYLTLTPVSSFGTDYVFSNTTNADLAVLGVYSNMGGDQGYGIRLSMYYPYDNDEMMGQGGNPGDNERRDIARYNAQPSNTQLPGPFNQLYAGIERANICIYNIPLMTQYDNGNETEKRKLRHLLGEALTLRAQYYQELIRNWGDVPAQFQPSALETDLFKAKTDRDSIYDRLLSDLAEASQLVPWRTQSGVTSERITQGAVRALRARIALQRGGYSLRRASRQMERPSNYKDFYQIALDECNQIIQRPNEHNLNPSFIAVWKDAICAQRPEPNGEIIWEVGSSGGGSGFGDSKLGYYNGPRWNGMGNSALTVLPTTFYAFDPADSRRDVTVCPYDIQQNLNITPRTFQALLDGKFRRDWSNTVTTSAQYLGINWPVIRFSDVLLMFAEADNEINNGPTAAGRQALERVRVRGFDGNASLIGTIPTDYTGFFEAVMKERMLELCGEGIRKYDLLRWNKLQERIAYVKEEMRKMVAKEAPYENLPNNMYFQQNSRTPIPANSYYDPSPTTAPAGTIGVSWIGPNITTTIINILANSFVPGKSELQPLPQASIDANPNLVQDYGH